MDQALEPNTFQLQVLAKISNISTSSFSQSFELSWTCAHLT